jgi:hypothetical protein
MKVRHFSSYAEVIAVAQTRLDAQLSGFFSELLEKVAATS